MDVVKAEMSKELLGSDYFVDDVMPLAYLAETSSYTNDKSKPFFSDHKICTNMRSMHHANVEDCDDFSFTLRDLGLV